jgi:hypothetical protein
VVELGIDFEPSSQRYQEIRVEVALEEDEGNVLSQGGFVRETGCMAEGNAAWCRVWIMLRLGALASF